MGQRSPDPAAAGTDQGGAASEPLDPVHRRAGPSLPALVHAGARGLLRVRTGPQSVVTEFVGPRTVKPGAAVPIQRAHATTAEEL